MNVVLYFVAVWHIRGLEDSVQSGVEWQTEPVRLRDPASFSAKSLLVASQLLYHSEVLLGSDIWQKHSASFSDAFVWNLIFDESL